VAIALPAGAMAQTNTAAPDPKGATELQEIVVTAQKREQRLIDVPMAITAITGDEIERRGVSNLQDLQYSVPGLSLIEQGPGQQRIQLRGISNLNGLPTVGQYLDEMPISIDDLTQNLDPRLIDMKQIEVLRGPQGTLYGEGSMGGTIRFLTADPDLGRFGGSLEGQAGSVTDGSTASKLNGVLNVPIVEDRVGVRLVAGYENTGGWIDDLVTGKKDVNDAKILTLRGKLLAKLTDNLQVSLLYLHEEQTQDYENFGKDRQTAAQVATNNNPNYDLVNAVVRWDIDRVSVVNSFGYQNARNDTAVDYSSVFVPILPFLGVPPGFITSVGLGSVSNINVYSDELRVASKPGGVLDWTVGLYGRKLDRDGTSRTFTAPGTLPFDLLAVSAIQKSKAWAAFGELDWHATDKLTVTGGLRYYDESRTFDGVSTVFGAPSPQSNTGDFNSLNPRLNVSYEFSPTSMVYVNAAKGFRSGGFNSAATGAPPTYGPETLWTYEMGTKHEWFDRRVTFEAALYYNDWKDIQTSVVPVGAQLGYIANGGKVDGWGADASLTARPAPGLTMSATYGWNNLEFKSASAQHAIGDPVDYAVRESWSGSIDYRRPVFGEVQGFGRLDYQHAGPSSDIDRSVGVNVKLGSRDTLNAQLGLDFGQYQVALFATNLTDETTPIVPGGIGILVEDLEPMPRVVGVNVKAKF
jgi:iron complex outermembrane receptor protein